MIALDGCQPEQIARAVPESITMENSKEVDFPLFLF